MNFYKKTIMAVVVFAAVSLGGVAVANRCQSCAEKMAIKQSIKDVLAAAIAANTVVSRDQAVDAETDKCGCSKPKPKPGRVKESVAVKSSGCAAESTCSLLTQQVQDIACANAACCKVVHRINDRVKEQGYDAKRCCHKIKEKIEDVEDLVISQSDAMADCCSVNEALLVSIIDQDADCCSVIEARIGQLDEPSFPDVIYDVNSTQADIITWLKSIYELASNANFCSPCS